LLSQAESVHILAAQIISISIQFGVDLLWSIICCVILEEYFPSNTGYKALWIAHCTDDIVDPFDWIYLPVDIASFYLYSSIIKFFQQEWCPAFTLTQMFTYYTLLCIEQYGETKLP